MTIEQVIKSTQPMPIARRTVLNIMYTQTVIAELFNDITKSYDLSHEQYNVLRILRGQKGTPANMSTIQERMIAKSSNTTRLIDKLLAKELVTREVCPANRRKMEILITAKGLALLAELDPKVDAHENHFSNNLSQLEMDTLNTLLEKFRGQ
jgi:DNA-binding MarR family transcriptional regulator